MKRIILFPLVQFGTVKSILFALICLDHLLKKISRRIVLQQLNVVGFCFSCTFESLCFERSNGFKVTLESEGLEDLFTCPQVIQRVVRENLPFSNSAKKVIIVLGSLSLREFVSRRIQISFKNIWSLSEQNIPLL